MPWEGRSEKKGRGGGRGGGGGSGRGERRRREGKDGIGRKKKKRAERGNGNGRGGMRKKGGRGEEMRRKFDKLRGSCVLAERGEGKDLLWREAKGRVVVDR
eukprot:768346-Hanusia_phi.AAC.2